MVWYVCSSHLATDLSWVSIETWYDDFDGTHIPDTTQTLPLLGTTYVPPIPPIASWENCKLCFVTKFHQSANNFYRATSR